MSNVITSVISFAMMLAVIFSVLNGVLKLTNESAETQTALRRDAAVAALGSLTVIGATATPDAGATNVDITMFNEGDLSYAQFKKWDVNISYTNGAGEMVLTRIPYRETLVDGTWSLEGVYMDSGRITAEFLEPSVFNPNEYMVIRVRLGDAALPGTRGWAVVTPEDGISTSVFFDA